MVDRADEPGSTVVCPMLDKLNEPLSVEPPNSGPYPIFLESSQARHWMLSRKELRDTRSKAQAQAKATLQRYVEDEGGAALDLLSEEDEISIIRFYLLRIGRLVKALGLPSLVEATAMTFMKRFYLRSSCMQFHPKLIMCVLISLT